MAAVEISDDTFEQEVIKAEKPVLVDFWAVWCAPCRAISPVVEEIATEQADRLKVVKVNVDDNFEVATKYGVLTVPTLLLFKDGERVETIRGAFSKHGILSKLEDHLN